MDTDTPQPTAPKHRRRFQFHLRTLFVVVTLASIPCAYVGWQAKIVRERKAWIEAHPNTVTFLSTDPTVPNYFGVKPAENPLSLVRRWLGDKPMQSIEFSDEDGLAAALFPEADWIFDPVAGKGSVLPHYQPR